MQTRLCRIIFWHFLRQYHRPQVFLDICFTSIAIKFYIWCHIFTCVRLYCGDISIDGTIVQMSQQYKAVKRFCLYLKRDCEDYLAVCRLDAVAV